MSVHVADTPAAPFHILLILGRSTSCLLAKRRPSMSSPPLRALEAPQDPNVSQAPVVTLGGAGLPVLVLGVSIVSLYLPWHKLYLLCKTKP